MRRTQVNAHAGRRLNAGGTSRRGSNSWFACFTVFAVWVLGCTVAWAQEEDPFGPVEEVFESATEVIEEAADPPLGEPQVEITVQAVAVEVAAPAAPAAAPAEAPAANPALPAPVAPAVAPKPGTPANPPTAGTAPKPAEPPKPTEPPKPAPPPPPPAGAVAVQTIDSERVVGKLGAIKDGKLTVQTEPARTFALEEIERVEFGGSAGALAVEWIGQDNHDVVQVGGAAGGNGIADMHLRLTGLPGNQKISQLVVVCRYPGQVRVWRLDTTQSPHWKVAMDRSGQASAADIYLEPTNIDAFEREFAVTVTYEGGNSEKVAVKASTHTSDQEKVGAPTASAAAASGPPTVSVHMDGSSLLIGKLLALDEESLTLASSWGKELKIPLVKVAAVWFASSGGPPAIKSKPKPAASAAADKTKGDKSKNDKSKPDDKDAAGEDSVTMLGRDGKSVTLEGRVLGFADGKLQVEYDGEKRTINQTRLVGVVLSAHPQPRPTASAYQVLQLASGDRISGQLAASLDKSLTIETAWDHALEIPRDVVSQISFRNGKQVFLSDVDPIGVEETPYFARRMPYRRDESLTGGPLKIKGTAYAKGLAVHSRSVLEFAVDGQYETFRALLGFDDDAGGRGAVACRVLGDDRELFKVPDLRAGGDPVPVEVSIAGVKQLTLEVDFGDLEDTGDRVIWAQPRIFRAGAASSERAAK